MKFTSLICLALLFSNTCYGQGNTEIQSFSKAKKTMERKIYFDHRQTLYCGALFRADKQVITPAGFTTAKHKKRAKRIEWEHVVPAENFGRTFLEWRDGHEQCVNKKGKSFKGRRCAEKVNLEYRYMQSDLYNLFPAIGAVNAMRSNYNFLALKNVQSDFGSCRMAIEDRKVIPPEAARGRIARTYLYMDVTYSRYKMSRSQRKLMQAWDRQHPVSAWECRRYTRIKAIQGNDNSIMNNRCAEIAENKKKQQKSLAARKDGQSKER